MYNENLVKNKYIMVSSSDTHLATVCLSKEAFDSNKTEGPAPASGLPGLCTDNVITEELFALRLSTHAP